MNDEDRLSIEIRTTEPTVSYQSPTVPPKSSALERRRSTMIGISRREKAERRRDDRDALPRRPTQPPLRPRPGESDEPEHGERRGDGREHVEDDELREDTADEKPVTRGLFPQGDLLGLERAHGMQESGCHETEGEPISAREAKELEKKGVSVQKGEPGEGHALSRNARQKTPGRDEEDRMRDQVRKTQRERGSPENRLGRPRKERVEQMVVRPHGTIERQGRERTPVHPVVPRESFVTGERHAHRTDHGVGEETARRAPPR